MRSKNFHAECATRHNEAALQRRADDAGEGRIKRKIVEKFKADANKAGFQMLECSGGEDRKTVVAPYGMPFAARVVFRPPSRKPSVCKSMIQTARLSPEIRQIEISLKAMQFPDKPSGFTCHRWLSDAS